MAYWQNQLLGYYYQQQQAKPPLTVAEANSFVHEIVTTLQVRHILRSKLEGQGLSC